MGIKISELPLGTANVNAVVPATNADGNVTEKIKLGDIAGLYEDWNVPTFSEGSFTASAGKKYYYKPTDVMLDGLDINDPSSPSNGDYYFFWNMSAQEIRVGGVSVPQGQIVVRYFTAGAISGVWTTQTTAAAGSFDGSYNSLSDVPSSFTPSAHAASHLFDGDGNPGSDPIFDQDLNTYNVPTFGGLSVRRADGTNAIGIVVGDAPYNYAKINQEDETGNWRFKVVSRSGDAPLIEGWTITAGQVTGLATVATSGSYNDLSDKPSEFTPAAHTHGVADITDFPYIGATWNQTSNSVVGGGRNNTASGYYNVVGGGYNNIASGTYSTVGGGYKNTAYEFSTVSGGLRNIASGMYSTVGGGINNLAASANSAVTGTNNVAAQKVGRAADIYWNGSGPRNQITVLNAAAEDFADTTASALHVRYFRNGNAYLIRSTVISATQSGNDVIVVLANNIFPSGVPQIWLNVSVVNTAATNSAVGQVVHGTSNIARSNYGTVSGGYNNTISGDFSTVGGGKNNTASGNVSTVGGGQQNTAGPDCTVGGGSRNTASNVYSTVSGGRYNTASGYISTVGGGRYNTAYDFSTVSGGYRNTASGTYSTVGGGRYNIASGTYSTVGGGQRAIADRYGMQAHSAGLFSAAGDAQRVDFVLRNSTTDATATTLFLDGSATRLTIPSGKALFATVTIAGIINGGSKAVHYCRKVAVKNAGGTTSLIGTVSTVGTDVEDDAAYDVAITADDTNDALQINVTGKTNETIRWVAHVEGVEIAYG